MPVCVAIYHVAAVPLSAVSSLSLDGEEMSKFEKTYPAMQARVRQRKFNLDSGFVEEDVEQDGEGLGEDGARPRGGEMFRR